MEYLLILLAVLALVGAGALWFLDSQDRASTSPAPPTPSPQPDQNQPAVRRRVSGKNQRSTGLVMPGAARRERRAWAQGHGFDFAKSDELLSGEWSRGAAASGAQPRDIASGSAYGHETHVMELGGVTVMAMRTGEVSEVVVDIRRDGFVADSSADLVQIDRVENFEVYASEAASVQRFLDVRVRTALEQLPECVAAIWCESDWVLAQTDRTPTSRDVDNLLAPLALIADAARVLPPQNWRTVEFGYRTREMVGVEVVQSEKAPDSAETPVVKRPEEPREMPTRTTGVVRGMIQQRAVGGDEVDAIAEGTSSNEAMGAPSAADLTRVRRNQTPPSIFGD